MEEATQDEIDVIVLDSELHFEPASGDRKLPAAPATIPLPRNAFAAVVLLAILFVIPSAAYWISSGTNVAVCLFGNASCSLTFAVYLLCFLSALSLVAVVWTGSCAYRAWMLGIVKDRGGMSPPDPGKDES